MGNTDHTPVHQENDSTNMPEKGVQQFDKSKEPLKNGNTGHPAESAESSNTPEQGGRSQPQPGKNGNPTTGKGSVEQDDEDVGGDQDIAPDPKIAPVVEGEADRNPGQAPKK